MRKPIFLLAFLIVIVIGLFMIRMVISNTISTSGVALGKTQDEITKFRTENMEFGVMIETPASCWIIEDLCKEGISFASFGTNDLTQLTLGIDRNNQKIANLFDEMHPAVLGEMAKVIKVCKKFGVETSVCGQAGSRKEMASFLVHQGINSISANADVVDKIREVVAKEEKRLKG